MERAGKIILVGAGSGDPELLTLKAVRALQNSDVILYDALVSPAVLELADKNAEKISVGKKGHGLSCRQADINEMMVRLALTGKTILRLKGGDPLIFSRAAEELEAARAANVPVEIISGITTAQTAAALLGIPLTTRETARRLQFVTGHDHKGGLPENMNWAALADANATTVIYMPKKTIKAMRDKLLEYGLPANTPAAAIMDASLASQRVINASINELPDRVEEAQLEGAVLVIIGEVLATIEPSANRS